MNFKKILFALSPEDEKTIWHALIANAVKLSRWLESEICIVSNDGNEVASLLGQRETSLTSASLFSLNDDLSFLEQIKKHIRETQTDLLLVAGWTQDQMDHSSSHLKIRLVEQCMIPCMVLPQDVALDYPPFREIVVPMSGEVKNSSALALGLKLAAEKNLPVDVIHVTSESEGAGEIFRDRSLEVMGDELQHEYPDIVDQFLSEASPMSGPEEKQRIRKFCHCCGDVKKELMDMLDRLPEALLLLEWGGTFEAERALIIKDLIIERRRSLLLIPRKKGVSMKLKLGNESDGGNLPI